MLLVEGASIWYARRQRHVRHDFFWASMVSRNITNYIKINLLNNQHIFLQKTGCNFNRFSLNKALKFQTFGAALLCQYFIG